MNTLQELIQRTEWLQHQVDEMQQTLDQLRADVTRHREALDAQLAGPSRSEDLADPDLPASSSADPSDTGAERRSLPRRRGNPVPVLIRRAPADPETVAGWVIDRSPEGLCLLADQQISVGTLVSVRPSHHAAGLQWFAVRVRNCRLERDAWILGCQFVHELSWDELRLFN